MLTIHQAEELLDNEKMLEHLSREGYGAELGALRAQLLKAPMPHFARNASKEQVLEGWRHVMMLHSKAGHSALGARSRERLSQRTDNRKFFRNCRQLCNRLKLRHLDLLLYIVSAGRVTQIMGSGGKRREFSLMSRAALSTTTYMGEWCSDSHRICRGQQRYSHLGATRHSPTLLGWVRRVRASPYGIFWSA